MAMLKSKLYEQELRKRQVNKRRSRIRRPIWLGTPDPFVRLDQSRIKDLRTNVEVGNTQGGWTAISTTSSKPA